MVTLDCIRDRWRRVTHPVIAVPVAILQTARPRPSSRHPFPRRNGSHLATANSDGPGPASNPPKRVNDDAIGMGICLTSVLRLKFRV